MVEPRMQINGANNNAAAPITANEFAAKFQSKAEVHYFLTVEVGAYLPAKEAVSIYFMKDLIMGKRKCK